MKAFSGTLLIWGIIIGLIYILKELFFSAQRKVRKRTYNEEYLKSDAWQRKRALVLKRDNWRCVYCGAKATQVHHKKYARSNIGKEPIEWLISVCSRCHEINHKNKN
jgi:5-methylcytosine-specific restriction endonuclease McrA